MREAAEHAPPRLGRCVGRLDRAECRFVVFFSSDRHWSYAHSMSCGSPHAHIVPYAAWLRTDRSTRLSALFPGFWAISAGGDGQQPKSVHPRLVAHGSARRGRAGRPSAWPAEGLHLPV